MRRLFALIFVILLTLVASAEVAAVEKPQYVIAFVPIRWQGSLDSFEPVAREHGELFLAESGIEQFAHVEFRFLRVEFDAPALTDPWLVQEVIAFGLLHEPADRYIGLTDADLAPNGDGSIVGWTLGPGSLGSVGEADALVVSAHELGHTFGLCDEYHYSEWSRQDISWGCPNPFPEDCSRTAFCPGLPAPDGRNSIMGSAGQPGGYAYNTPSLAHLHGIFSALFADGDMPAPPVSEPTTGPGPTPPMQSLAVADPALVLLGADGDRLELAPGPVLHPAVSPDGREIAFAAPYQGSLDIYRLSLSGGSPERLTTSAGRESHPLWFPDSRRILYLSEAGDSAKLMLLELDAGRSLELPDLPTSISWPALSESGEMLAFSRLSNRDWELHLVQLGPDGLPIPGSLRRLTESPGADISPLWSADGKTLYFASARDGDLDLFKMRVSDLTTAPLTRSPLPEWGAQRLADGRLVFHRFDGEHMRLGLLDVDHGRIMPLAAAMSVAWPAPIPEEQ